MAVDGGGEGPRGMRDSETERSGEDGETSAGKEGMLEEGIKETMAVIRAKLEKRKGWQWAECRIILRMRAVDDL